MPSHTKCVVYYSHNKIHSAQYQMRSSCLYRIKKKSLEFESNYKLGIGM